jgi:alpha-tubulin suppressor-like RCC1 family protein
MRLSSSRLDAERGRIDQASLKDYAETLVGGASGTRVGSTYTINLAQGNVFHLVLTSNCAFTFSVTAASGTAPSFTLILKQDGVGGRTVTWPASVVWAGGVPTLSTGALKSDIFSFVSDDAGVTWRGFAPQKDTAMAQNEMWTVGQGTHGALGIDDSTDYSSPVQVAVTTWAQVSAGGTHTAAIKANGELWMWGLGTTGQLGNNAALTRSSPVQVAGTTWAQVTTGGVITAAVRTNGTLWTWGTGANGRLGTNSVLNRSSPTQVAGTTWAQVSTGFTHAAAIRSDGTLWTWGLGTLGALGNNSTLTRSSPVQVAGTTWAQVSAGNAHTLAVRTDGTLWAWGDNGAGRLGNSGNVSADVSSPVQVAGTDWAQVSAGNGHSAALRTDGTLWTWGYNVQGQLGIDVGGATSANRSSPVQVAGTDWVQVSAGNGHTAAIRTDGTLWTWGSGGAGRLGNDDTTNQSSPVQVAGTTWALVSAGSSHTAAIPSK